MSIGLGPHLRLVALGVISHWCPACDCAHHLHMGGAGREGLDWDHNTSRPTFSPDVRQPNGCRYWITMGCIEFADDAQHILAGRVVPLPVYPPRQP